MRGVAFSVTLLLSLCINAMGFADDTQKVDLPPIDSPDHWHLMTQDDATSTSKCIGDPKTPLCAVETVRACFMREDDELCRIGMGKPNMPPGIKTKIQPDYTERYWIIGSEIVTPKNLKGLSFDSNRPKIGDVVIKINDAPCYGAKCYSPVGPPTIYYLRRTGNKWRVAGGGEPRW